MGLVSIPPPYMIPSSPGEDVVVVISEEEVALEIGLGLSVPLRMNKPHRLCCETHEVIYREPFHLLGEHGCNYYYNIS